MIGPKNQAREEKLDEALADYLRRIDDGEPVDRAQFLAAYADLADDLAPLLDAGDWVDRMAGPVAGSNVADSDDADDDATVEFSSETASQIHIGETRDFTPGKPDEKQNTLEREFLELPCPFGEYELLEILGRGGMGIVFKARQRALDRLVAVKMIRDACLASDDDIQRFYIEAKAAGKLSHPNLVTVHEVGEQDGHHFYSMDYIDGTNLSGMVRNGPLDGNRAARYLMIVARAMQVAHDNGILHRDLKPGNVIIDVNDQPHVADFGLAKHQDSESGLTVSGAALGTPSYMPPEQARGDHGNVSAASDVYSMGAILYVLLTGRSPFYGESAVDTLMTVIHKEPIPPHQVNPHVDRDLETICLKCMDKKPSRRYRSAGQLADELERFLHGRPILARPASRIEKACRWLGRVPMIAAATGGRSGEPTPGQRRMNWAIILTPILVLAWLLAWNAIPRRMPSRVRIAAAAPGGMYETFANAYATILQVESKRPVEVVNTGGSLDNAERLLADETNLALLQENAVHSDELAVIAPLYFDVVFVVVRKNRGIASFGDLAGHRVSIGKPKSGMRLNSVGILQYAADTRDRILAADIHFSELLTDQSLDAAIVTTSPQNGNLLQLLNTGEFELIALDDDLIEKLTLHFPSFRSYSIRRGGIKLEAAAGVTIPDQRLLTVATTTFLCARRDAPDKLITTVLQTLYGSESLHNDFSLLSAQEACRWQEFALHSAAHRFFQEIARSARATPD